MGMEAEVGKNLSREEDAEAGKNSAEEEGELGENLAEEKEDKSIAVQVEIDPGAEKSCNDDKTMDAEEPTSEGGSAVTNKGQIMLSEAEKTQVIDDAEKPHLPGVLAVLEEGDASKQAQLKEKKEKKRKRELVEVKKEHQEGTLFSKTEKKRKRKLLKIKKEHQEGTLLSKAEKKRWRVELVKIKEEHEMGSGEITWRWHAIYSMRLDRRITRLHEGSILQRAEARRIFLLDMDGTAVDAYNLMEGESVHPGSVFYFPCHKADVGERILEPDVCSEDEAALALVEGGIDDEKEKPPSKRDEKKRKHLKRKGMSESSFSAGGRIISDHRTRLRSNTVEGLICLQDWLNAADSKPTNKDVEVEEYLVFQQGSKWREEGRARSRTRRLSTRISSSPSPSPASSSSPSP